MADPRLAGSRGDRPWPRPRSKIKPAETQAFGEPKSVPLGLDDNARSASVASLNQILADTMAIRDLYKKHHWQVSGATFYSLHLLLDKHFTEQAAMVDSLAERIMTLGGISIAMAQDVAEMSKVPRPPQVREDAQPSSSARSGSPRPPRCARSRRASRSWSPPVRWRASAPRCSRPGAWR